LTGRTDKRFDADSYHQGNGSVVPVEGGRSVEHNQSLKDHFRACMMRDVNYLAIPLRNQYRTSQDFAKVCRFSNILCASWPLLLPLCGVFANGY
jgi:hypothetical protein